MLVRPAEWVDTATTLRALGHPFRLAVVHAVSCGEARPDLARIADRWQVPEDEVQGHVQELLRARVLTGTAAGSGGPLRLAHGRLTELVSRLDRL